MLVFLFCFFSIFTQRHRDRQEEVKKPGQEPITQWTLDRAYHDHLIGSVLNLR